MEPEGTQIEQDLPPAQRHIIKRPRLTKLLDEAEARIILLVAPAGYGKTTLAREWLGEPTRRVTWFQAKPTSTDIAALATGIARAVSPVQPSALARVSERLGMTAAPDAEPEALAEMLAQYLREWPKDAWLVIDDYHVIRGTMTAERFIESLANATPLHLLITSRERPSWVTARDLLYGEALELNRADLAMTPTEAREALAGHSPSQLTGVMALANGWPAIIGLAAFTNRPVEPSTELPSTIHDFLADELFRATPLDSRAGLCLLSLVPKITGPLIRELIGAKAGEVVDDGFRFGFLSTGAENEITIHPLLRGFLRSKGEEEFAEATYEAAQRLALFFINTRQWDEAFAVIQEHGQSTLLPGLFEQAIWDLLKEGRLSTLKRWIEHARMVKMDLPITNLAEAELSWRRGDYPLGESLALSAARGFGDDAAWTARAYGCAGRSAHHMDASRRAVAHHTNALALAKDSSERRKALWGQLIAALNVPDFDTTPILREFTAAAGDAPDDVLRLAQARLIIASSNGGLENTVADALGAADVLHHARDPLVRSGFLNNLADALTLTGRYHQALKFAAAELDEADRFRVRFVRPHACLNLAGASIGLGEFTRAHAHLTEDQRGANDYADPHLHVNLMIVRMRLAIAQGDATRIAKISWPELQAGLEAPARPTIMSELIATCALASACAGQIGPAQELASEALTLPPHVTAVVLAAATSAIVGLIADPSDLTGVSNLIRAIADTGNLDSAICALRGYAPLSRTLAAHGEGRKILQLAVRRSGDRALAAGVELPLPPKPSRLAVQLSQREQEIVGLLAEGLRNRDIAERLFISEKTVKAHLQHIYDKLDVHNRVEAVRRVSQPTPRQ